jgi:hypothetical protein
MASIGFLTNDVRENVIQGGACFSSGARALLDASNGVTALTAPDGALRLSLCASNGFFVDAASHASNGFYVPPNVIAQLSVQAGYTVYMRPAAVGAALPVSFMWDLLNTPNP